MEREVSGTVISVSKQWWLKVNRKPIRTGPLDGAELPHVIKVNMRLMVLNTRAESGFMREK